MKTLKDIIKKIKNILITLINIFSINMILFLLIPVILITIFTIIACLPGSIQESEAGYIVTKTTENKFHYIIDENGTATPEFEDEYYYTMFIDDIYIKFQIPYKVFTEYNLGDHLTVYRECDIFKCYNNYEVEIYDIRVPAVVIEDEK